MAGNLHEDLFTFIIQDVHKRMVQFRKLTRNLFLTLHGHNVRRQQRQLSKVRKDAQCMVRLF